MSKQGTGRLGGRQEFVVRWEETAARQDVSVAEGQFLARQDLERRKRAVEQKVSLAVKQAIGNLATRVWEAQICVGREAQVDVGREVQVALEMSVYITCLPENAQVGDLVRRGDFSFEIPEGKTSVFFEDTGKRFEAMGPHSRYWERVE